MIRRRNDDQAIRGEFRARYDEHARGRTIQTAIDHYRAAVNDDKAALFTREMWETISGAKYRTDARDHVYEQMMGSFGGGRA